MSKKKSVRNLKKRNSHKTLNKNKENTIDFSKYNKKANKTSSIKKITTDKKDEEDFFKSDLDHNSININDKSKKNTDNSKNKSSSSTSSNFNDPFKNLNSKNLDFNKLKTLVQAKKLYDSLKQNPFDTSDNSFNINNEKTIYNRIFQKNQTETSGNCLSDKLKEERKKLKEKKYIEEMVNYNVQTLNSINSNIQNIFSENNFAINRMKKFQLFNSEKELSRIVVASDLNNIRKKRVIYKIRVGAVKDFFNGIFKGFKFINSKGTKIIKNGKIYLVKENYNGYFICPNLRKGIHYDAMLNLKLNFKNFDYSNYNNSANYLMKLLRDLVIAVGKSCTGINDLLEIIESHILKMRKTTEKDREKLIALETFKNQANNELDILSFESAGFNIGKILGYSKLFQQ